MKSTVLFLCSLSLASCSRTPESHVRRPGHPWYPKFSNDYFYPADSNTTVFDTTTSLFTVRTELFPIPDSTRILYKGYIDSETVDDRIKYRDYAVRIKIASPGGTNILTRTIYKNEFLSLTNGQLDLKYYFIRDVAFVEYANDEFRFDITCSYTDSPKRHLMLKYFISSANASRLEDYPEEFYKKEFPPDF